MRTGDIDQAVDDLVSASLPFDLYEVGIEGDGVEIWVPPDKVAEAAAFFVESPLTLADGTAVPVVVRGRAGGGWISEPPSGPAYEPTPVPEAVLLGIDVHEAARLANAAGWLVRAHEPDAVLTADLRPHRLNLCYDADRRVVYVHVG